MICVANNPSSLSSPATPKTGSDVMPRDGTDCLESRIGHREICMKPTQFSLRQMLVATFVCAVLAALAAPFFTAFGPANCRAQCHGSRWPMRLRPIDCMACTPAAECGRPRGRHSAASRPAIAGRRCAAGRWRGDFCCKHCGDGDRRASSGWQRGFQCGGLQCVLGCIDLGTALVSTGNLRAGNHSRRKCAHPMGRSEILFVGNRSRSAELDPGPCDATGVYQSAAGQARRNRCAARGEDRRTRRADSRDGHERRTAGPNGIAFSQECQERYGRRIHPLPSRECSAVPERGQQQLFLLQPVAAGRAGGGAGGALAVDAGQRQAVEEPVAEVAAQEPPGAHVLRLFLHPKHRRAVRHSRPAPLRAVPWGTDKAARRGRSPRCRASNRPASAPTRNRSFPSRATRARSAVRPGGATSGITR